MRPRFTLPGRSLKVHVPVVCQATDARQKVGFFDKIALSAIIQRLKDLQPPPGVSNLDDQQLKDQILASSFWHTPTNRVQTPVDGFFHACRFLNPRERKGQSRRTENKKKAPAPQAAAAPMQTEADEKTYAYLCNELQRSQDELKHRDRTLSKLAQGQAAAVLVRQREIQDRTRQHGEYAARFAQSQTSAKAFQADVASWLASFLAQESQAFHSAEAEHQTWIQAAQSSIATLKERNRQEMGDAQAKFEALAELVALQEQLVTDAAKRAGKDQFP